MFRDGVGDANFIVGLDSNATWEWSGAFQDKLREMGMHFGDNPDAQQVTVAKMRTVFQTQVKKAGETDVSHKDFILTWDRARRVATKYMPEIWTKFGIDNDGKTIRLPTTSWPFDHAAVAAIVLVCR